MSSEGLGTMKMVFRKIRGVVNVKGGWVHFKRNWLKNQLNSTSTEFGRKKRRNIATTLVAQRTRQNTTKIGNFQKKCAKMYNQKIPELPTHLNMMNIWLKNSRRFKNVELRCRASTSRSSPGEVLRAGSSTVSSMAACEGEEGTSVAHWRRSQRRWGGDGGGFLVENLREKKTPGHGGKKQAPSSTVACD